LVVHLLEAHTLCSEIVPRLFRLSGVRWGQVVALWFLRSHRREVRCDYENTEKNGSATMPSLTGGVCRAMLLDVLHVDLEVTSRDGGGISVTDGTSNGIGDARTKLHTEGVEVEDHRS
jgi:hypothetical protein